MTRRPDQRWAIRDADLMVAWVGTLLLGAVIRPLFYVAVAAGFLLIAFLVAKHLRRRRRWREQPPGEFWADRVKK